MDRIQLLVLIARRASSTIDESLSALLDLASDHAHELLRIRTSRRELDHVSERVGERVGEGGKQHEMYSLRAKESEGKFRKTCHMVMSCLNPLMQLVPDENDRLVAGLNTMSVPELQISFVQKLKDSSKQAEGDAMELWQSTVDGDSQAIVRDVADRFEAVLNRRYVRDLPYDPTYDDRGDQNDHDDHERHDFQIPAIHGGRASRHSRHSRNSRNSRNEGAHCATVACVALTALTTMSAIVGSVTGSVTGSAVGIVAG